MPIYEYRCPNCGVFEVTQRITDKPLQTCPHCNEPVKKLRSATTLVSSSRVGFLRDGQQERRFGQQGQVCRF